METKEAKKEAAPPVIGVVAGDRAATLELVQKPEPIEIVWTRERIDVLKRQCCPPDITDDEFFVFLEQCKRTGMDPLLGEADCISRGGYQKVRDPQSGQIIEKWVEKKTFSPREAGMRSRADRFADYRGISSQAVREGDDFFIDKKKKEVHHIFNPADPKRKQKPIMGAWAQITRDGRLCDVRWIDISERLQTKKDGKATQFWSLKVETMIDKCARAEAYRLEYPNAFSGLYIREEMSEVDEEGNEKEINSPPPGATREQRENDGKTRTQQVKEQVKAQAAAQKPRGQQTVDAPKPTPPKGETQKEGARMAFGPEAVKGRLISELSGQEIAEMIDLGTAQAQKYPTASWAPTVKACLEALRSEQEARFVAATAPEREPGEDREEEPPPPGEPPAP